jgi:peptidoglycan endopeptidase LytE
MKVSKVVLIVVALHVLVIGGIFIFEGCSRAKTSAPEMAENETPATDSAANLPALPAENALAPAQPSPAVVAQTTAPAARTYTVKKGDSLWKIAKSQSVSIGDLARANNLSKTTALKVGQKLQIPAAAKSETVTAQASVVPTSADSTAPTTTAAATPMEGNIYIVKTGDSLGKIARAQNISVAAIKQANSLSGDSLRIGQKLHIPTATAAATPTAQAGIATTSEKEWQTGPVTENGQQYHIVDIGESPATIAKRYGIKVEDLMKANGISDARRIMVGQKLSIPTQPAATPAPAPAASTTPAAAAPIVSAKN